MCTVHTVNINTDFCPDIIMSLSTNVVQWGESFFNFPAVNWRNTFNTVWRQHKAIIFILCVIRCSSVFNSVIPKFGHVTGVTEEQNSVRYYGKCPHPANWICASEELDNATLRSVLSLTDCTFVLTENNVPCFPSLHLHPYRVQYDSLKQSKIKYFSLYPLYL